MVTARSFFTSFCGIFGLRPSGRRATALHHSAQRPVPKKQEGEDAEYVVSRGQKTDTRVRGGLRPALLAEPHVVDRLQRHIVEQTVDSAPGLQILDAPVPQMGDQLAEVLKIIYMSLPVFAEQVIEVPKINLQDIIPQRSVLRGPQLAEQLAEVPTIAPQSSFQQHLVEQNVDNPVPGHRGVLDACGLHGFPAEHFMVRPLLV